MSLGGRAGSPSAQLDANKQQPGSEDGVSHGSCAIGWALTDVGQHPGMKCKAGGVQGEPLCVSAQHHPAAHK